MDFISATTIYGKEIETQLKRLRSESNIAEEIDDYAKKANNTFSQTVRIIDSSIEQLITKEYFTKQEEENIKGLLTPIMALFKSNKKDGWYDKTIKENPEIIPNLENIEKLYKKVGGYLFLEEFVNLGYGTNLLKHGLRGGQYHLITKASDLINQSIDKMLKEKDETIYKNIEAIKLIHNNCYSIERITNELIPEVFDYIKNIAKESKEQLINDINKEIEELSKDTTDFRHQQGKKIFKLILKKIENQDSIERTFKELESDVNWHINAGNSLNHLAEFIYFNAITELRAPNINKIEELLKIIKSPKETKDNA